MNTILNKKVSKMPLQVFITYITNRGKARMMLLLDKNRSFEEIKEAGVSGPPPFI